MWTGSSDVLAWNSCVHTSMPFTKLTCLLLPIPSCLLLCVVSKYMWPSDNSLKKLTCYFEYVNDYCLIVGCCFFFNKKNCACVFKRKMRFTISQYLFLLSEKARKCWHYIASSIALLQVLSSPDFFICKSTVQDWKKWTL